MPKATVSTLTSKFDLKTLPGGWVELRRMSFGEKQQRQDIAMQMAMTTDGQKAKSTEAIMKMSSEEIALFELSRCVIDHNLYADDEEKVKLDFKRSADIRQLDPRVGEEINALIDSMNNVSAEDLADLGNGSSSS